mmetsp:Transcript_11624/g.13144  ORF Transcript_11624/g.13144 Transcript_11624/m.13144 type:complete len:300 (-) Transcript_11624:27-926(-)
MEALAGAFNNDFDTLIIITGDRDFLGCFQKITNEHGKTVKICGFDKSLWKEYHNQGYGIEVLRLEDIWNTAIGKYLIENSEIPDVVAHIEPEMASYNKPEMVPYNEPEMVDYKDPKMVHYNEFEMIDIIPPNEPKNIKKRVPHDNGRNDQNFQRGRGKNHFKSNKRNFKNKKINQKENQSFPNINIMNKANRDFSSSELSLKKIEVKQAQPLSKMDLSLPPQKRKELISQKNNKKLDPEAVQYPDLSTSETTDSTYFEGIKSTSKSKIMTSLAVNDFEAELALYITDGDLERCKSFLHN